VQDTVRLPWSQARCLATDRTRVLSRS